MAADFRAALAAKRARISSIENDKKRLLDTILKTASDEVRAMCETCIDELSAEKSSLEESLNKPEKEPMPLAQALDYVMEFITSPREIWAAGDYYQKQGVLNLCFSSQISYDKKNKFGTPELSPIFAILTRI